MTKHTEDKTKPVEEDIEQMKKDSKIIENAYINSKTDRAKECSCHCHRVCVLVKPFCKCPIVTCEHCKPEESWEQEWDKRFPLGGEIWVLDRHFKEVKDYIKSNFIPKKELTEMLEGMKKKELNCHENHDFFVRGYNQALDEAEQNINKLSEEGEND